MVTHANWKIENGVLVILCTDGQGWWHPIKVSIVGEHGETCVVRQEPRIDEDWSHEQGDDRVLADYGIGFRGISVHDKPEYGWALPENREEDRCTADLPEVLTMRPEVYIRKYIPVQRNLLWDDVFEPPPWIAKAKYSPRIPTKVELWNIATDMVLNDLMAHVNVHEWEEWAKDCPNP